MTRSIIDDHISQNPYCFYEHIRQDGGIVYDQGIGCWLVAGYDSVCSVITGKSFSANNIDYYRAKLADDQIAKPEVLFDLLEPRLMFCDGEQRLRQKRLLSSGFTPNAMAKLRPIIEGEADGCLRDHFQSDGDLEFVSTVAQVIPRRLLGGMEIHFSRRVVFYQGI